MIFIDPEIQAARAARSGIVAHILVYLRARNRTTNVTESMGLWTGADHQAINIGGEARDYYGAGNILQVPALQSEVGLQVRTYEVGLSQTSPEVNLLVRGYDVRGCPIEWHRAEYDQGGNLIGPPERLFKGWVSGAPITTPAIGGGGGISLRVVSSSWQLTKHGAGTKSDAYQRLRGGDRMRRYASIARDAEVFWGEERAKAAGASGRVVPKSFKDMF